MRATSTSIPLHITLTPLRNGITTISILTHIRHRHNAKISSALSCSPSFLPSAVAAATAIITRRHASSLTRSFGCMIYQFDPDDGDDFEGIGCGCAEEDLMPPGLLKSTIWWSQTLADPCSLVVGVELMVV